MLTENPPRFVGQNDWIKKDTATTSRPGIIIKNTIKEKPCQFQKSTTVVHLLPSA